MHDMYVCIYVCVYVCTRQLGPPPAGYIPLSGWFGWFEAEGGGREAGRRERERGEREDREKRERERMAPSLLQLQVQRAVYKYMCKYYFATYTILYVCYFLHFARRRRRLTLN